MSDSKAIQKQPKTRRLWLNRLRWFLICYLLFVLAGCWGHLVDRFIMFPSQQPLDTKGATREMLKLPGGDEVELWHARSPGAQGAEPLAFVITFVGNADRADRVATFNAAQWGDKPVELIGMNYPGYGGSTGPAHLDKIAPAALATYDMVRSRAGKRPIFVQSTSLGTTAALCLLARRDIAGATLQSPPPLRQLILARHGWWNLWLIALPAAFTIPSDIDSFANAPGAKAPVVFVLSERDEVVPVALQRMVLDRYAGEKHIIDLPNATHNTGMDEAAWDTFDQQLDWLWAKAGLGR